MICARTVGGGVSAALLVCAGVLPLAAQRPLPEQQQTLARFEPPYRLPPGVDIHADVVYASPGGRDLRVDVFVPASGEGPYPFVLFIQGSGHNGNNKVHFWREAAHMAALGFVAASIEHRGLRPDGARWPAQLEDSRDALEWLASHADRFRIDPERVGVVGASSGAHMAALLALMDRREAAPRVSAAVLINGVLDLPYFARNRVHSREYGGMRVDFARLLGASWEEDPTRWHAASPATYADSGDPPVLIIHGTDDGTLPFEQARGFHDALLAADVRARLIPIEGGDHEMTNAVAYRRTLAEIEVFMTRWLGRGPGSRPSR